MLASRPCLPARRLALSLLLAASSVAGSVGGSVAAPIPPAPTVSVADSTVVTDRASAAFAAFVHVYWNPNTRLFWAMSDHSVRRGGTSRTADFWWSAELWEVVMDRYEATHDAAARKLIDAVWDGFVAAHPTLASDYNDDRNWWALGATRAYRLTSEQRFLDAASRIANDVWRSWDSTFGGGIWWRRSVHDQKNVATNAASAITAAHLYQATHSTTWRDRALRLFRWVDASLRTGDRVWDRVTSAGVNHAQYTYNYGTYLGAAATLQTITGDATYLAKAVAAAMRAVATFAPNGILRSEGTGDGGAFRGIFLRSLTNLAVSHDQPSFAVFVRTNASTAWWHRNSAGVFGPDWTVRPTGAVDAAIESSGVALLQFAVPASEMLEARLAVPVSLVDRIR